ncbi:helix-turn-helix domain-containing protein [Streptosporangium sp. NBC_01810]|uniref:hypothetical protein n=1 Tax=Streptosporangium sp. NBC_01810 TaxID=2975951 RepID=UPI002DDBBD88|nr:hypothetical protein [Streptosporangium sp. NBC_01810]WSA27444.1 helix-turn-helix domain-containing protein [Streptosporangium sp. NBC_01810]
MNEEERGVAIDEADLPAWARSRFSAAQLQLHKGLQWVLLIYMSTSLEASRLSVAQRLYVHTIGKERKEAKPSLESLARDLNISPQTAVVSIQDLEEQGWVVVKRVSTHFNIYRLAWPLENVLAADKEVDKCGRLTKKGEVCTRRAGWGTDTPGVGPCKLHPIQPQPLELKEDPEDPNELQPLESTESDSTPTVGNFNSNHWSNELQPLEQLTPTVGVEYEGSALRSSLLSTSTPVLSEGQLTVRTARALHAPSANQSGFAARSLVSAIPRYRAAPGWVKKNLATLADAALAAGFHRDAIVQYAAAVIAEARFAEHQHIPEFRDALRRLGRDAALGDLPAIPEPAQADPDAPWTDEDQAAWERVLDHLGVEDADLDTTGTP